MIKKNLIILFFVFLVGCGFKPILSSKNSTLSIENIKFTNSNQINLKIKNQLNRYKSNKNNSKKFNLAIKSEKSRTIEVKDKKGDPKLFSINISISVDTYQNGNKINTKKFEKNFSYKNKSNKFSLKEYEKNIENSLIEKIIEEIILNLDSI